MTGLHAIPARTLTLRFTRTDNPTRSFTTTAEGIEINPLTIRETGTERLIARIDCDAFGAPFYRPPDRKSQVWYDTLTITTGDDS